MNDFRDLKAIAEACQQHQPLRFMPSHGALYIRNDNGIVFDVHQNRSFPEFMAQNKDYADLVLAANPATVLALIAENERQAAQFKEWQASHHANYCKVADERDKLKAEVDSLTREADRQYTTIEAYRKDAERYQWLRDKSEAVHQFYLSVPLWFTGVRFRSRDVDNAIDAMSKGEQS